MLFPLASQTPARTCASAQRRRQAKMDALAPTFDAALTDADAKVHSLTLAQLVDAHRAGSVSTADVLSAYGKKAFAAQKATNCLADVMLSDLLILHPKPDAAPAHIDDDDFCDPFAKLKSDSHRHSDPKLDEDRGRAGVHRPHRNGHAVGNGWHEDVVTKTEPEPEDDADSHTDAHTDTDTSADSDADDRPLSGVPISVKDCIDVAGCASTLGYTAFADTSVRTSAPIVQLLQRAGALVHVKTTVPTGLFSMETTTTLFGRTTNPYNPAYSPGASTGGGGALLALGGSAIEIGTDIGGSVRIPAAFCGVYSMKATHGRFPSTGARTSTPGLESVPTVVSPLARRLEDLEEFWKRVMGLRPWEIDHTCVPMPWRPVDFGARKLRWGVLWSDGMIPMTPAAERALRIVIDALKAQGHEIVDFAPPAAEVLKTGFQLAFADGAAQVFAPLQRSDAINPGIRALKATFALPKLVKRVLASFLPALDAGLLRAFHPKSVRETRALVVEREAWKRAWHERWREQGVDLVLCAPCAVPGLPEGGTGVAGLVAASYAFLFSILDLPAGVLPVTTVCAERDALPADFRASALGPSARGAYACYDAAAMHGLPVGVQVVGRRFEEEKVLAGMRVVRGAVGAFEGALC